MESIFAVAGYTLKQHIRHRVYLSLLLFAVILMGGALIVSSLAIDEQVRMLTNIGLGGIEFLSLVAVIFLTVGLILEEMESRSIYLVLSHPIERWQYILGRYLGTVVALVLGIVLMGLLHLGILLLKNWSFDPFYFIALFCSILKIIVVGSLALLISLITTSTATSMVFTTFLWVLGHFTSEMRFMAEKSTNPIVKGITWVIQHVAPDFNYFNYRDFWDAVQLPPGQWWGWLILYTACYLGMTLLLSSWLFSKREF